jgi:hypothetical protein
MPDRQSRETRPTVSLRVPILLFPGHHAARRFVVTALDALVEAAAAVVEAATRTVQRAGWQGVAALRRTEDVAATQRVRRHTILTTLHGQQDTDAGPHEAKTLAVIKSERVRAPCAVVVAERELRRVGRVFRQAGGTLPLGGSDSVQRSQSDSSTFAGFAVLELQRSQAEVLLAAEMARGDLD